MTAPAESDTQVDKRHRGRTGVNVEHLKSKPIAIEPKGFFEVVDEQVDLKEVRPQPSCCGHSPEHAACTEAKRRQR
jgi:hypothetical protein